MEFIGAADGEHPAGCIYGGFSAYTSYWLAIDGCLLPHPTPVPLNATCRVCGAKSGDIHDAEDAAHTAYAVNNGIPH